jgi:hypothetical protein
MSHDADRHYDADEPWQPESRNQPSYQPSAASADDEPLPAHEFVAPVVDHANQRDYHQQRPYYQDWGYGQADGAVYHHAQTYSAQHYYAETDHPAYSWTSHQDQVRPLSSQFTPAATIPPPPLPPQHNWHAGMQASSAFGPFGPFGPAESRKRPRPPAAHMESNTAASDEPMESDSDDKRSKGKQKTAMQRFIWPEDLHRDFVSAVFTTGLKQ